MPSAAVTLILGGVSAAAIGAAELKALVLATTTALGFAADAFAVSGIAANGSDTSVGIVISGDSLAGAEAFADGLLAALPSFAPAGLAGAIAASRPAFANLVSVTTAGAMAFGDAAPPSSVGATMILRGAGVHSATYGVPEETAFLEALAAFLNVVAAQLDVSAPFDVAGGVSMSLTIAAANSAQAASLVATLAAALPSNQTSATPSLWQATNSSGLSQVTSIEAYGAPYMQVATAADGSAPVASTTLLLQGIAASLIGAPEEAALCEVLAEALQCAPDAILISGMTSSAAGALVGVVMFADSAPAAAALAATLDLILPATVLQNGLAAVLSGGLSSLAGLTAVSAANDTVLVGDAAPCASMEATLVLGGAGVSAASFSATQQAAFAAALSTFLGVEGAALALTGTSNGANGGVAVSFTVAAAGAVQAAALAAVLGSGGTSNATSSTPALWQAVNRGGLPQVVNVTALGVPAAAA